MKYCTGTDYSTCDSSTIDFLL